MNAMKISIEKPVAEKKTNCMSSVAFTAIARGADPDL